MNAWVAMFLLALSVNANVNVRPSVNAIEEVKNAQFSHVHDLNENTVLIGPSGVVTKNGQNLQFTDDQIASGVPSQWGQFIAQRGVARPTGIPRQRDSNVHLIPKQAQNFDLVKPFGIVEVLEEKSVPKGYPNPKFNKGNVSRIPRAFNNTQAK